VVTHTNLQQTTGNCCKVEEGTAGVKGVEVEGGMAATRNLSCPLPIQLTLSSSFQEDSASGYNKEEDKCGTVTFRYRRQVRATSEFTYKILYQSSSGVLRRAPEGNRLTVTLIPWRQCTSGLRDAYGVAEMRGQLLNKIRFLAKMYTGYSRVLAQCRKKSISEGTS
jgi:hypothetical protein